MSPCQEGGGSQLTVLSRPFYAPNAASLGVHGSGFVLAVL